jgi:pyruvate kinase
MSRRLRRTKIVTTLGPATDRDNNLEKVIAAGANVVRMNFSHGTPEDHQMRADKVRQIAAKLGRHVAILGDLQGPKIRVSTFKEGKIFLISATNSCLMQSWQRRRRQRESRY